MICLLDIIIGKEFLFQKNFDISVSSKKDKSKKKCIKIVYLKGRIFYYGKSVRFEKKGGIGKKVGF